MWSVKESRASAQLMAATQQFNATKKQNKVNIETVCIKKKKTLLIKKIYIKQLQSLTQPHEDLAYAPSIVQR